MADLIAVMHDGRLQQLATPAEIYARPANLFVATLLRLAADERARRRGRRRRLPARRRRAAAAGRGARGPVKLGFRPEHAELVAPGASGALNGEIYVVEPLGNETLVTVTARRRAGQRARRRRSSRGRSAALRGAAHRSGSHLFERESGVVLATAFRQQPTGTRRSIDGRRKGENNERRTRDTGRLLGRGAVGAAGLFEARLAGRAAAAGSPLEQRTAARARPAARSRSGASRTTRWRRSATLHQAFHRRDRHHGQVQRDELRHLVPERKNDGLNKTGAYDIYVMDDNWVRNSRPARSSRA